MNTCRRLLSCNVTPPPFSPPPSPPPSVFCQPVHTQTHTHSYCEECFRAASDSIWYNHSWRWRHGDMRAFGVGFLCVVRFCSNIKEHSSKVWTNTATSLFSVSSKCFLKKPSLGLENNPKCCTSTLLPVCQFGGEPISTCCSARR